MSYDNDTSSRPEKSNEEKIISLLDTIALLERLQLEKQTKILKIANFFFILAILALVLSVISILGTG